LIRKTEHFNFEEAKAKVLNYLYGLITLTYREQLFIENFRNRKYCPDLLFEDNEIVKRIKQHPMAVWKTAN
jgi:hypothetical protein